MSYIFTPIIDVSKLPKGIEEFTVIVGKNLNMITCKDTEGRVIYEKLTNNEVWYEYDTQGRLIHEKDSDGYEYWYMYDLDGNLTCRKCSDGKKVWNDYFFKRENTD